MSTLRHATFLSDKPGGWAGVAPASAARLSTDRTLGVRGVACSTHESSLDTTRVGIANFDRLVRNASRGVVKFRAPATLVNACKLFSTSVKSSSDKFVPIKKESAARSAGQAASIMSREVNRTFVVTSAVGRVDRSRAGGARVTLSPKCRCRCNTMEEYLGRTLFANPSERETRHWRTRRNTYASGMTGGSALSSWSMLQVVDEPLSHERKLDYSHHCNFIDDPTKLNPASGAP